MPLRKSATERKECGCPNRVDGHRAGSTGSVPGYGNVHEFFVPYRVSAVFGTPLAEAKKPAPGKALTRFFFLINFGYGKNLSKIIPGE